MKLRPLGNHVLLQPTEADICCQIKYGIILEIGVGGKPEDSIIRNAGVGPGAMVMYRPDPSFHVGDYMQGNNLVIVPENDILAVVYKS